MSDKEQLAEAWEAFCEDNHCDYDDQEAFLLFQGGWQAHEALNG